MNWALKLYAAGNRSGLFKGPAGQRLFSRAYFFYKAHFEDAFTPVVRERPELFAGGHILDVGANIGYTATLFAHALTAGFQVYAFEPEESNFALLKQSVADRHLEKMVYPVRAAVGDHDGVSELWLNPGHHADHRMLTPTFQGDPGVPPETQVVPLIRLDHFSAQDLSNKPVSFIKIDVQGYEECVCRGMAETLQKNPQALIGVEYYPRGIAQLGFKPEAIPNFFEEKGYHVYSLTRRGGIRPAQYGDIPGIVGTKAYIDLLFSKSDKIAGGAIR